jgi:hypothetical protein
MQNVEDFDKNCISYYVVKDCFMLNQCSWTMIKKIKIVIYILLKTFVIISIFFLSHYFGDTI